MVEVNEMGHSDDNSEQAKSPFEDEKETGIWARPVSGAGQPSNNPDQDAGPPEKYGEEASFHDRAQVGASGEQHGASTPFSGLSTDGEASPRSVEGPGAPLGEHTADDPPYSRYEGDADQQVTPSESTRGGSSVPTPPLAPSPRKRSSALPLLLGALLCLIIGVLIGWGLIEISLPPNSGMIGYRHGGMSSEQVIALGRQAVVQINVLKGQAKGLGSGVVIDHQGHIVTNNHVVSGGQDFSVVLFDGTVLPAQLVGADAADDLAMIKIKPPHRMYAMPIGDSSKLEVGNPVLAMGNPLGITQTVTSGIVSALGRTVSEEPDGKGTIVDAVQTDAAINPGNSGGALVDMNGKLVGIPTLVPIDPEFKTPAMGVGFAIPSNRVKFIAPQLIQYGKVKHSGRASLGATVTTVDSLVAAQSNLSVNHGALIVSTAPNGPSAQAGLRAGDVIVHLNDMQINTVADLSDALLTYDPGTTVTVGIMRGTEQKQVKVKLGELTVS